MVKTHYEVTGLDFSGLFSNLFFLGIFQIPKGDTKYIE